MIIYCLQQLNQNKTHMLRIGLLSDTRSYLDESIFNYFA